MRIILERERDNRVYNPTQDAESLPSRRTMARLPQRMTPSGSRKALGQIQLASRARFASIAEASSVFVTLMQKARKPTGHGRKGRGSDLPSVRRRGGPMPQPRRVLSARRGAVEEECGLTNCANPRPQTRRDQSSRFGGALRWDQSPRRSSCSLPEVVIPARFRPCVAWSTA